MNGEIKDHRVVVAQCTCARVPLRERLVLWHRRAQRVLRRLPQHGHRIDQKRYERTLELMVGIATKHPDSFSLLNWNRSHHMVDCPCHPRQNPKGRVKVLPLTQCQR